VYLLFLAQMTASGLHIIHSLDEVKLLTLGYGNVETRPTKGSQN